MYNQLNARSAVFGLGLVLACSDPPTPGDDPPGPDAASTGSSGLEDPPPTGTTTSTSGDETAGADPTSPSGSSSSDAFKFDVGGETDGQDTFGVPGPGCEFIDILFVVDISLSMEEEHDQLAASFPEFVQVLDDYVDDPRTPATGYRVGITNSSIVDNGTAGLSTAGLDGSLVSSGPFGSDCGNEGARWLDGPDPGLADVFSCLADRPYGDCAEGDCSDRGKERPFDATAMFMAKHAPGEDNEGFYRGSESLFVVVNLTDEDDDPQFSTRTPALAIDGIEDFVGGAGRVVLVTIAGPENTNCPPFSRGTAFPAPRLHEFTSLAANGLMGDICQANLAQPLADALALIQGSCDVLPPPEG